MADITNKVKDLVNSYVKVIKYIPDCGATQITGLGKVMDSDKGDLPIIVYNDKSEMKYVEFNPFETELHKEKAQMPKLYVKSGNFSIKPYEGKLDEDSLRIMKK